VRGERRSKGHSPAAARQAKFNERSRNVDENKGRLAEAVSRQEVPARTAQPVCDAEIEVIAA
jgi:hypothetical protein